MKISIYAMVIMFSYNLIAQDPQLFDTTWILHELNVNNTIITPPNSQVLSELTFLTDGINNVMEVNQSSCIGYAGEIQEFNDNDSLFNLLEFADPFGANCSGDDSLFTFLQNHASLYIDLPSSPPLNPFNYEITEENSVITLTVTNGNNDTAIYRNVPLSLEENELDNLKVIYNAQNETLLLTGYVLEPTIKIAIYNLVGQQQETSDFTNGTSINVKNLPTGIYLITLRNNNGQNVIRKFVKY